ncbi:MAG: TlyA family RNA methyltransferase [Deltaproteobacteria bacterium]|nr:TlyA family RNA methyltransferase [Deltaproteobacteria bacterium]
MARFPFCWRNADWIQWGYLIRLGSCAVRVGIRDISGEKTRADLLVVKKGLAESREKARALIMAGAVEFDGIRAEKPGHLIPDSAHISVKKPYPPYVSRGGLKLESALDFFKLDVDGLTLIDVGASTGGFTDCLLQRGARRVIAVDVGYGQFHWKLRNDDRVRLIERQNIRHLLPEDLDEKINGAVIDVSFISLKLVIPPVSRLLLEDAFIIALIKPQFEVGKSNVGKGGVVRDPELHDMVIKDLYGFFKKLEWSIIGHIPSPILGPKGNREFLIYLKRNNQGRTSKYQLTLR